MCSVLKYLVCALQLTKMLCFIFYTTFKCCKLPIFKKKHTATYCNIRHLGLLLENVFSRCIHTSILLIVISITRPSIKCVIQARRDNWLDKVNRYIQCKKSVGFLCIRSCLVGFCRWQLRHSFIYCNAIHRIKRPELTLLHKSKK